MAIPRPLVLSERETASSAPTGPRVRSQVDYAELTGPGYEGFLRNGETAAGVAVTAESAMRVAAVYRCVSIIAGAIGGLSWRLMREADGRREQVSEHPVAKLFRRRPNRWQSWFDFMSMLEAHKLLRGNGYAFKVISGSRVIGLIPLHPDRTNPIQLPDTTLVYEYIRPTGEKVVFRQDEVLHVRDLSWDGIKGLSRLAMMREAVGLAVQAERYGARLFKNDTALGSAFKMPEGKSLSDEAYARLKASLDENTGADNAHKNILLEEGLDFVRLGLTSQDAQFIEGRRFQRSDIFMFFGVPPFLAGDTEKSTSWGTGLEQQGGGFRMYTLQSEINAWKGSVKRDLLTEDEGEELQPDLDASDYQQATVKDQSDADAKALGAGGHQPWKTVNEVRKARGLNPIEGGDKLPDRPGATPAPNATEREDDPANAA